MLQATFHTEEGAERFWEALVPLFELLGDAPGFIRRYGFGDGPSNTLIALWQTIEDAKTFAATHNTVRSYATCIANDGNTPTLPRCGK